jgi:hypothetical protein
LGREAATPAASYEEARRADQAKKKVGAEADSSDGVQLGNEQGEEDNAYTRARVGSETEKERRAKRLQLRPVGPAHYATREREKAAGLRDWETGRARRARPSGRKLRREKISIFFSFSNISNAFSNCF